MSCVSPYTNRLHFQDTFFVSFFFLQLTKNTNKIKSSYLKWWKYVVLHMTATLCNCFDNLFNFFLLPCGWHFRHFQVRQEKKCEVKTHSYNACQMKIEANPKFSLMFYTNWLYVNWEALLSLSACNKCTTHSHLYVFTFE